MATTNIYPTIDGYINKTSNSSWDAVRDATSGTTVDTTDDQDSLAAQAGYLMGGWFVGRGYFTFAIPDNIASISAATFRLTETSEASNAPNGYVIASAKASATAIVLADFDNIDFSTAYSSAVTLSGTVTTTLNAAALTALNSAIGGYFECAYVEDTYDYTDTDPGSNASYGGLRWSEYSGTSSDPMLTLTYTAKPTSPHLNILSGTMTIKSGNFTMKKT